jgi:hypothetical protein
MKEAFETMEEHWIITAGLCIFIYNIVEEICSAIKTRRK